MPARPFRRASQCNVSNIIQLLVNTAYFHFYFSMTMHIHIQGLVQGVGFRPLVSKLADMLQLKGYVSNGNDGVHIYINGTESQALHFVEQIKKESTTLAIIEKYELAVAKHIHFTGFEIRESTNHESTGVPLTPDYAMCETCRQELTDPNNKRFQYPFITCTTCGPRYSIADELPYDREHTSMKHFFMCEHCANEYQSPANRRYHSQTNSCHVCGIKTTLYNSQGAMIADGNQPAVQATVRLLKDGKVVAVKGIGGYLLLVDAANAVAVQMLRQRKQRPHKPFAVLFSSVEAAQSYVQLTDASLKILQSETAPIVLAAVKDHPPTKLAHAEIAPSLNTLGVMIPYAPLLQLISSAIGIPLIASSANLTGSPIIYEDDMALEELSGIADAVLLHNRAILIPQDDSVVKVSQLGRQIIMRRSRGLAPYYPGYKARSKQNILATGALIKSSFALSYRHLVHVSQYLGDTSYYEAQLAYQHTLQHLLNILKVTPECIVADKHPAYFSSRFAVELSEQYQVPLCYVQHHKAHFSAVLAENNLLREKKVLGVIWDGTGWGDDGQIWGSEFFIYDEMSMQRCNHLSYFKNVLSDKMASEPRLAALSIGAGNPNVYALIRNKFSDTEWRLYTNMLQQPNTISSCSMGRLFDAVACLLQLCDKQSYEGQAAILLETKATEYITRRGYDIEASEFQPGDFTNLSAEAILHAVAEEIISGRETGYIAAAFHYRLLQMIDAVAQKEGVEKIAFSGGVFQNALLCDMILQHLGKRYQLYFHRQLSPNDENISFGQLVYWDNRIDEMGYYNAEVKSNAEVGSELY